ncbi:unnamed protein product [Brugia pahangi]|uniref:DNA helicase n=1 Tax=Brugia pahangi TaxID=6280 RepID=A0A0N4TQ94_BRUPA|nr:unnamed protein product [Brugia pahangi]
MLAVMISTSFSDLVGHHHNSILDNDYRPFPKNYIPVCVVYRTERHYGRNDSFHPEIIHITEIFTVDPITMFISLSYCIKTSSRRTAGLLDELFNRCRFPAVVVFFAVKEEHYLHQRSRIKYIKGQTVIFQIENDEIAITDQSSSLRLFSYNYSSVIIVISLAQCSHKKPRIQDRKDKTEVKKKVKSAHTPAPEEKIRDKQDKTDKEKERLKEMEEKRIEERKPKIMKRNAKEERIAKGKETRGKGDYSTMDDVLSDWDSERDGKKINEDDGQKSRANTNLEGVRRKKLIAEGKAVVEVRQNMLQKAVQKTPNDHLIALKRWIKQLVVRRNDDVPLFIGFAFPCILLKPTYLLAERWKV